MILSTKELWTQRKFNEIPDRNGNFVQVYDRLLFICPPVDSMINENIHPVPLNLDYLKKIDFKEACLSYFQFRDKLLFTRIINVKDSIQYWEFSIDCLPCAPEQVNRRPIAVYKWVHQIQNLIYDLYGEMIQWNI